MKKFLSASNIAIILVLGFTLISQRADVFAAQAEDSARVAFKLENLFGQWDFDRERLDEFFNEAVEAQVKEGVTRPSDSELARRKNLVRNSLDEMPSYSFATGHTANEVLLTMSRTDGFKNTKPLSLKDGHPAAGLFDLTDENSAPVKIVVTDLDHIKYFATGNGYTVGMPLVKKTPATKNNSKTFIPATEVSSTLSAEDKAALLKQTEIVQATINQWDFDAMMKHEHPAVFKLMSKDAFAQAGRAAVAQMKEMGVNSLLK